MTFKINAIASNPKGGSGSGAGAGTGSAGPGGVTASGVSSIIGWEF